MAQAHQEELRNIVRKLFGAQCAIASKALRPTELSALRHSSI
jgi:hypothetical protein